MSLGLDKDTFFNPCRGIASLPLPTAEEQSPISLLVLDVGEHLVGPDWGSMSGSVGYHVYRGPIHGVSNQSCMEKGWLLHTYVL